MKYTVLTYIFGGYECVHEIGMKDPDADYILVTDDPSLRSRTWRVVVEEQYGMNAMERCYDVRFHPFRYAETEYVIRLDSSIEIYQPLRVLVDKMVRGDYDRCLMIHPGRNTMQDEYEAWIFQRHYPREQAERCLNIMRELGYSFDYRGLFQGCFEIVRRNRVNDDINELTYRLLRYAAGDGRIERVDQTFLSFVINHLYSDRLKVLPVSQKIVADGAYMQWYLHNSHRANRQKPTIKPFMFDRPVIPFI